MLLFFPSGFLDVANVVAFDDFFFFPVGAVFPVVQFLLEG